MLNWFCLIGAMAELGRRPDFATYIESSVMNSNKVIAACHKHGKHPGMGGVYVPSVMQRYVNMGMRLILAGSEFTFLMAGAKAQAQAVRALK